MPDNSFTIFTNKFKNALHNSFTLQVLFLNLSGKRSRVVGIFFWPNTCVIDSNFHVQTSLAANKPQNLLTALQFLMGPSSQNCVIYIKHFPSFRPKIAWFSFFFFASDIDIFPTGKPLTSFYDLMSSDKRLFARLYLLRRFPFLLVEFSVHNVPDVR